MTHFDAYGIGNALLDTEYEVTDNFLVSQGFVKGRRHQIDFDGKQKLLATLEAVPSRSSAGGSVANSIYAAQGFGCKCGFLGLMAKDYEGFTYQQEMVAAGIDVSAFATSSDSHTGHCLVFITPEGERTMVAEVGVSGELAPQHVEEAKVANSEIVFLEAYLACTPNNQATALKVAKLASQFKRRLALTLSDVLIIDEYREFLQEICEFGLDVLFCNVDEAKCWANRESIEAALQQLINDTNIAVVTDAGKGCYVASRAQSMEKVSGYPIEAVDCTGAGDMFAGAFLTGLTKQWDLLGCAKFANFAASRTVANFGARFPTIEHYREVSNEFRGD
ncbi:MAG: adenosine kinase [Gammaproteobacteria bacterium]|nr:adenosine kinase [Gammaproteobacteria bacterium]MXX95798.1 adenosine kinase [Gammaproteobacteria bacterium]MYF52850.1 adenosine kinase [Gammaproteobacteria bacterium]MYK42726.1 adenosine kinase [Gammaproteobacteria bacterium]